MFDGGVHTDSIARTVEPQDQHVIRDRGKKGQNKRENSSYLAGNI